jgi:hypothetical protein
MVSAAELIEQVSNTIGKTKVLELTRILKEQQFALRDLIDITFHSDKDVAFRAAWILENLFLQEPERYKTDLTYLLSRIKDIKHASCQRHYVKILMHITSPKAIAIIKNKINEMDLESAVEQCFDWMSDPKIKIAAKCFAAEVLFNLRDRYPWIKDELDNQLHFLMRNGSPGIQSKGRRLLAKLR